MVGKQVGQYSDSDRVSHSQQSLPKGARGSEVPRAQKESEREEPPTSSEERRLAQYPGAIAENRLSSWESLQRQGPEKERRREIDSQPWADWDSLDCCTCVYIVYRVYTYTEIHGRYFRLTPFLCEYNTRLEKQLFLKNESTINIFCAFRNFVVKLSKILNKLIQSFQFAGYGL